jgi:hypothetical protein
VWEIFFLDGLFRYDQDNQGVIKVFFPLKKSQEIPQYVFCPRQKIISCTFRIRGTLVFLCPYIYKREREIKRERERKKCM